MKPRKLQIYLVRQDPAGLHGDYLAAAVVIAENQDQAKARVLRAFKAGGYRGDRGFWSNLVIETNPNEVPLCEAGRLSMELLGLATPRQRSRILLMTFGRDYDVSHSP